MPDSNRSLSSALALNEAAMHLNISVPYLESLLASGVIPSQNLGGARRVLLRDLMEYKRRADAGA